MNKKKIFIWSLYDFANSFVMIAFFLYFSQWLVVDRGISDFWFNICLTIASLIYIALGPVLGSIADKSGDKATGMRVTTLVCGAFYLLTGFVAVMFPMHYVIAIVLFTIASGTYLLSFIYYSSFLRELAPPEKRGTVSGWGTFANYLGQIAAIFVCLPFATGKVTFFGESGHAQALIPATLIFLILAIPLLVVFKKQKCMEGTEPERIYIKTEYKSFWSSFVDLCKTPNLGRFFLAYFFFNDAVITASNNFPIYMDRVFGMDDATKSYILLGILVTSAIGSPLSGWIADKIGLKKTLFWILAGWIVIFPALSIATSVTAVFVITAIMGLWFGSVWTVTRAMVLLYTPASKTNLSYAYFTVMERFATLIGPVSWGLIVTFGPHAHALNYRAAAFSMAIFVAIGLFIMKKLPR